MQTFSLDNSNGFQIKFPRPVSKSQTKPPRDPKDTTNLTESKTSKEITKEPPARKIVRDMSNSSLIENQAKEADFVTNFEEKIRGVLVENEKLRKKIEFSSTMLENLLKFDENRDVFELKSFVRGNYKRFHGILDEIFNFKEEIEKTKELKESLEKESKEKKEEELSKKEENEPLEKEIKELESKIIEVSKEIKEMSVKNDKLREVVNKKPFFREFELMGKEEEGLKKQNQSLTEMIKREQEKKKP